MVRLCVILSLLICLVPCRLTAQEEDRIIIDSQGDVEFDQVTGIITATNGVVVIYKGATLSSRRAIMNQNTGDVDAEGEVRLEREGQLWTGERLQYNFNTGRMSGEEFRTGQPPMFAEGAAVVADQTADVYVLSRGSVTTDDYAVPAYKIQAKSLVIVPGQYIEARHATLRFGDVPVFYFPYFRRTLKDPGNHWSITPGYRSVDGPYLLTSYNWYWDERLDGVLHLDGRLNRGLGGGPDFNWNLPRFGEGSFKGYYLNDDDPGRDLFGNDNDRDRYRIHLEHIARPRTNLTIRGAFRYQSDTDIIRDFFESEYRDNVQPSTFLEVNQLWHNYSLNILGQPRVNDFYETVERLPDVKLSGFRQQIGPTPLYYESETTAGWYRRKFANNDTNHFSAARADTFHKITLPKTYMNWLNLTPRVGGRFTHYGEADGQGVTTDQVDRWIFNTGAEVSTKASRVWRGTRSAFWDVDGLRHILQPSVNYVYIPRPHPDVAQLPQFDYLVPSSRLLPIEFPDFNSVDTIASQNALRFGLGNKLQTKREEAIDNLLNWQLFMDWHMDPGPGVSTYSDIYSDADLKPFSWLTLTSQNRFDVNDGSFNEANHALTFTPNDRWSFTVGQRFLDDVDTFGPDSGNNLFYGTFYYRVSEDWGFRINERFEAEDGVLEEQNYTIYRDLRSWTSALTVRVRDERDGPTDVTVALTLSLKTFPRLGLGEDVNRPVLLLGN